MHAGTSGVQRALRVCTGTEDVRWVPGMCAGDGQCALVVGLHIGVPAGYRRTRGHSILGCLCQDAPHQIFCPPQDLGSAWQALGECPCTAAMIDTSYSSSLLYSPYLFNVLIPNFLPAKLIKTNEGKTIIKKDKTLIMQCISESSSASVLYRKAGPFLS